MTLDALILAGGTSTRMGSDKALLSVGGQTLLARQVGLAREAGAREISISGRAGVDYSGFGCPVLIDTVSEAGPLAGIERGLDALSSGILLVLAVDLPLMSAECLRYILSGNQSDGCIPVVAGRIEPLVAFYPKAAGTLAAQLLRSQDRSATKFAQECVRAGLATFIQIPADKAGCFKNWNSPMDYAAVQPE